MNSCHMSKKGLRVVVLKYIIIFCTLLDRRIVAGKQLDNRFCKHKIVTLLIVSPFFD